MIGNKIQVYKILNGLEKVAQELLFSLFGNTKTKGHSMKLKNGKFRIDKREYFVTQCVIRLRNMLHRKLLRPRMWQGSKRD